VGFGVLELWGLGFEVWRFGVWGVGVWTLGLRNWGLGSRAYCSAKVQSYSPILIIYLFGAGLTDTGV